MKPKGPRITLPSCEFDFDQYYDIKGWQLPKMQKYIPDLPLP